MNLTDKIGKTTRKIIIPIVLVTYMTTLGSGCTLTYGMSSKDNGIREMDKNKINDSYNNIFDANHSSTFKNPTNHYNSFRNPCN